MASQWNWERFAAVVEQLMLELEAVIVVPEPVGEEHWEIICEKAGIVTKG